MDAVRLVILEADIKRQVNTIEKLFEKVEEIKNPGSCYEWESLAYRLHNLYCGFEDLFEIVAKAFENQIEERGRYHSDLLKRMVTEIPGVRPALLRPDTFDLLNNLRGFRHVFRWAYSAGIDVRKVRLVLEDALALRGRYRDDVEEFIARLRTSVKRRQKL